MNISPWKRLRYRCEWLGIWLLSTLIPLIPRRLVLLGAKCLGRLAYCLDRRGRTTAIENLKAAYEDDFGDEDLTPPAYLLRRPRGARRMALEEIDANSGEARVLVSESSDHLIEPNLQLGAKPNVRVLASGEVIWYSERDGWGHLYLYGEKTAEISLIEASSSKWSEKGRFTLPKSSQLSPPNGKNWTRPVIADGQLYLRDQDLLFRYRIK